MRPYNTGVASKTILALSFSPRFQSLPSPTLCTTSFLREPDLYLVVIFLVLQQSQPMCAILLIVRWLSPDKFRSSCLDQNLLYNWSCPIQEKLPGFVNSFKVLFSFRYSRFNNDQHKKNEANKINC